MLEGAHRALGDATLSARASWRRGWRRRPAQVAARLSDMPSLAPRRHDETIRLLWSEAGPTARE
eukprot:6164854-Alexandrium_andersonii.AAC.1